MPKKFSLGIFFHWFRIVSAIRLWYTVFEKQFAHICINLWHRIYTKRWKQKLNQCCEGFDKIVRKIIWLYHKKRSAEHGYFEKHRCNGKTHLCGPGKNQLYPHQHLCGGNQSCQYHQGWAGKRGYGSCHRRIYGRNRWHPQGFAESTGQRMGDQRLPPFGQHPTGRSDRRVCLCTAGQRHRPVWQKGQDRFGQ